uniref:Uncharacterized protein n=1 Tax=Pseudictyota dubia TaxID=2749911 RepID=A0A7R9Z1N1_9STRA|mmetsp:Transcript_17220/g.32121  ORF Transcript_17220/g.32121 Transcript_17220/m.32121 type:complete len:222 (+) Transcript_17220:145-810(+)
MSASTGTTTQTYTPYASDSAPPRMGHRCCGCCCDMKTAVFVVDIISLVFSALVLFIWVPGLKLMASDEFQEDYEEAVSQQAADITDDAVKQDYENNAKQAFQFTSDVAEDAIPWVTAAAIVSIVAFALGIYGSLSVRQWPVLVALIVHVFNCCMSFVFLQLIPALFAGFFAYPHVVFIIEMRKGIFSRNHGVTDEVLPEIEATPVSPKASAYSNEENEGIV